MKQTKKFCLFFPSKNIFTWQSTIHHLFMNFCFVSNKKEFLVWDVERNLSIFRVSCVHSWNITLSENFHFKMKWKIYARGRTSDKERSPCDIFSQPTRSHQLSQPTHTHTHPMATIIYDAYLMASHECHDISTTCLIFIIANICFVLTYSVPVNAIAYVNHCRCLVYLSTPKCAPFGT